MTRFHWVGADLLTDEEYRMLGEAVQMAAPLPPGLDWDYFRDDKNELGDTENPAVDAVFDWGQPLIGSHRFPRRPNLEGRVERACIPQPCIPLDQWQRRPMIRGWDVGKEPGLPPVPCPPRPCGLPRAPAGWTPPTGLEVGADSSDWEICERVVPPGSESFSPVVSGGARFRSLVRALRARGARNPEALAAYIGRKKYGAQRFARMAAAGRR